MRLAGVFGSLAVALASLALAPRASSADTTTPAPAPAAKPPAAATLQECVTAATESERTATFAGEMSAIPGSAKMEMRIDVLERDPQEASFHVITAAGLGAWRVAAPGVKIYKYLKQVTNLAAPAYYRGAVHFRWLNDKGKTIRATELRTPRCLQTVPAGEEQPSGETPAKTA